MRTVLFLIGWLPLSLSAQILYTQDFEAFEVGSTIAAADPGHWRTWSDPPGPTQDAPVIDSMAASGNHCLAFIQAEPPTVSGPRDVVLLLGYHLHGRYVLSWKMYLRDNRGASIVLYHTEDVPYADPAAFLRFVPWYIPSLGVVQQFTVDADRELYNAYFEPNTWVEVALGFDLDTREATAWLEGVLVASWAFNTMPSGAPAPNILGAVRFMGSSGMLFGVGEYYIDDVVFQKGTAVGINEQQPGPMQALQIAPNPSGGSTVLSTGAALGNAELAVHDASGRVVWQAAWPAGEERYMLPAGTLAPGAYVVRVSFGSAQDGTRTGRLVVMP